MTAAKIPTTKELTKYFIPLALGAISQGLTYPLVAMVASRGEGGTLNLAGFAQASTFSFFLTTLAWGIFTAGMVYGKTKEGYQKFIAANYIMTGVVALLHLIFMTPTLSHLVFGVIMGLPDSIEGPARHSFSLCVAFQVALIFRNKYQVLLFIKRKTGLAYVATISRILITLCLSFVLSKAGHVGIFWALACLTLPIILEVIIYRFLAAPYLRNMDPGKESPPSLSEILKFSFTISVGLLFMSLSSYIIGSFIARAADPERMLPAYYLALGIAHPVCHGVVRIRIMIISYYGDQTTNRRLIKFSALASIVGGLLPLLLILPGIISIYYVYLQKLPVADLNLVRISALALVGFTISMGLRGYCEGVASVQKKPTAILAGQGTYLGIASTVSFVALNVGVAGNLIGPAATISANIISSLIMMIALSWKQGNTPVLAGKSELER